MFEDISVIQTLHESFLSGNFSVVWSGSLHLMKKMKMLVAIKKKKGKALLLLFTSYLQLTF